MVDHPFSKSIKIFKNYAAINMSKIQGEESGNLVIKKNKTDE